MKVFVQMKVFNPALIGKAVRVFGFTIDGEHWDRLFLVKDVAGEYIDLVNYQGKELCVHMENFEHPNDALKIIVLEEMKNE